MSRRQVLTMEKSLQELPASSAAAETWAKEFSNQLKVMESFSEGDHDKGANDPDVQALIGKARNQICQYATPEWVQHSPILFAGFEEAFKLLAQAQGQHAHPSPSSSAPLSASSTLVSKEPSVGVSKGSAQRDLRSTIQQVPPTIPAAVAAIKNSPLQANSTDASPLQTQHSAPSPSPSSALPPRAALISPSPRSILRTGSAAAPSQLPSRPARSASAALDVKSSVTITDAEIMPPPTQGAVAKSGPITRGSAKRLQAHAPPTKSAGEKVQTPVERMRQEHERVFEKPNARALIKYWEGEIVAGQAEVKAGNVRIKNAEKEIRDIKEAVISLTSSEEDEPRPKKVRVGGKARVTRAKVKPEDA
ncbi:hypothetical protein V8E53_013853 [Lactarius tabidus]